MNRPLVALPFVTHLTTSPWIRVMIMAEVTVRAKACVWVMFRGFSNDLRICLSFGVMPRHALVYIENKNGSGKSSIE